MSVLGRYYRSKLTRVVAGVTACALLTLIPESASANHYPSTTSVYIYPGCNVVSGGYTHRGSNRIWYNASRQLTLWSYAMWDYPVNNNKNNNDIYHYVDWQGVGWTYISPDSLANTSTYTALPEGFYTYLSYSGHFDGFGYHRDQSFYAFDRPGTDPSCWSVWYV